MGLVTLSAISGLLGLFVLFAVRVVWPYNIRFKRNDHRFFFKFVLVSAGLKGLFLLSLSFAAAFQLWMWGG